MTGAFVLAQVTRIKGNCFSYTACTTCNSKVNEAFNDNTASKSWHCGKCRRLLSQHECRERYRLCMSVTDGDTCRDVNVFGSNLQPMFGISANDLSRCVTDVTVRELLREAIQHVFVGSLFLFGFKSTFRRCALSQRYRRSPVRLSALAPTSGSMVAWQMLTAGGERTTVINELQRLMHSKDDDESAEESFQPSLPLTRCSIGTIGSSSYSQLSSRRLTNIQRVNACRFSCDGNSTLHSRSSTQFQEGMKEQSLMEESIEVARHCSSDSQTSTVDLQSLVVDVDFEESLGFSDIELSSDDVSRVVTPQENTPGVLLQSAHLKSHGVLSEQNNSCSDLLPNDELLFAGAKVAVNPTECDEPSTGCMDEMMDSGVMCARQNDLLTGEQSHCPDVANSKSFAPKHSSKLLSNDLCFDVTVAKGHTFSDSGVSTLTSLRFGERSDIGSRISEDCSAFSVLEDDRKILISKDNHQCLTVNTEGSSQRPSSEFDPQHSFSEKFDTLPYSEDIDAFLQDVALCDNDVLPQKTVVPVINKTKDAEHDLERCLPSVKDSQIQIEAKSSDHVRLSVNDLAKHCTTTYQTAVSSDLCLSTSSFDLFNSSSSDLDVSANSTQVTCVSPNRVPAGVDGIQSITTDKCCVSKLKTHSTCIKRVRFAHRSSSAPTYRSIRSSPTVKSASLNRSLLQSQDLFAVSPINDIQGTCTLEMNKTICSDSDNDDIIPPSFMPSAKTSSPLLNLPPFDALTSSNAASPELFSQAPHIGDSSTNLSPFCWDKQLSPTQNEDTVQTSDIHSQDLFSDSSLFNSNSVCRLDF